MRGRHNRRETSMTDMTITVPVGQHGYTQKHHDTLMGPWVSVMGDPFDTTTLFA